MDLQTHIGCNSCLCFKPMFVLKCGSRGCPYGIDVSQRDGYWHTSCCKGCRREPGNHDPRCSKILPPQSSQADTTDAITAGATDFRPDFVAYTTELATASDTIFGPLWVPEGLPHSMNLQQLLVLAHIADVSTRQVWLNVFEDFYTGVISRQTDE